MKVELRVAYTVLLILGCSLGLLAQGSTLVEERKAGIFKVRVFENEVPMHSTFTLKVLNNAEEVIDYLEFVGVATSATGCSTDLYGEYSFLSERKFMVVIEKKEVHCAADPDDPNGVDLSEFLNIIDPYEIVSQQKVTKTTKVYSISENGKILLNSQQEAILKNKIASLELFDLMPKKNLRIVRNYVFAKHGYAFKSAELQQLFAEFAWYKPVYTNVDDKLTANDKKIIAYILELEKN